MNRYSSRIYSSISSSFLDTGTCSVVTGQLCSRWPAIFFLQSQVMGMTMRAQLSYKGIAPIFLYPATALTRGQASRGAISSPTEKAV